ncbi:MAG TPA: GNAT family N-acetyltransferase [Jiangellaceae bacterium]|nr:GNAT family N-acetyltransferase [Jiangellaceae bacterium]
MTAKVPEPAIRPARPDEYTTVGNITVAAYRAAGMARGRYVDDLRDAARRAAEAELLVAVDAGGVVLGSVTFCPAGSSWREIARDNEGEFRMLAVDPGVQGQGVGRALIEACLDRTRELGFSGLALSTPRGNGRAHRLYEQLGFRRDPARDWSPIPEVDLVVYELRLS